MTVTLERQPRRRALQGHESGEARKRWPLSRLFGVGVTASALVALIVVALGAFGLWQLTEARSRLLDVGGPSSLAAERLSAALLNQETGVRGVQLSAGAPDFVDPYRAGVEAEMTQAGIIRRLSGEPGQEAIRTALDAVVGGAAQWRAEYAEPVIGGAALSPEQGRAQFERVRAEVGNLTAALAAQQQVLRAGLNGAATFLIWIGVTIVVLLAAFLVATGLGLRAYVLKPVAKLAGEVREVVSGNVQREVRTDGPREIVQLGEDIESMRRHILSDLIDAQSVNQRLDEQARDLERSNRDLEQFAYVASHDLQEPLRKVSSFCQLLQRRYGGQLDARADQYIDFAVDGAQRMQRLINDLLSFSRVGRTTEAFAPVDLSAVAKTVATQLEGLRADAEGTFEIGELPEVTGDRALLQQLLVNLMGNGLKFHRDGVPPVVRVQAERRGDNWDITVADNGIGIEPEYAEKVFVIFQRLHGRDRYPGTGIGLALAKKIAEFHGGRIGLDPRDETDPGTTIRFALPVVAAAPVDAVQTAVPTAVPTDAAEETP